MFQKYSLHKVGMLQPSAQIVSTQPLPPEMANSICLKAGRRSLPPAWLCSSQKCGTSSFYVSCSDCVGICGNVCCVAAVVENSGF